MCLAAPEPEAPGGGTVTKAEGVFVVLSGTAGTVGLDSDHAFILQFKGRGKKTSGFKSSPQLVANTKARKRLNTHTYVCV